MLVLITKQSPTLLQSEGLKCRQKSDKHDKNITRQCTKIKLIDLIDFCIKFLLVKLKCSDFGMQFRVFIHQSIVCSELRQNLIFRLRHTITQI